MNPPLTTQPLPPLETTTTPTPLSIEGVLSEQVIEANKEEQSTPSFSCKNSLYLGKFSINNNSLIGTNVYEFDASFPLGKVDNKYYSQPLNNGILRMLCPWSLIPVWFSRQCKIDYTLVFQPVKISDSRVSIDSFYRYSELEITTYNTDAFVNDSVSNYIDDGDGLIFNQIPLYWPTDFVPTRAFRMSNQNRPPSFLPKTRMTTFIRSPYVPTLMHPNSFDVLVYLIPMISVAATTVAATRVTRAVPSSDNYLPLPYIFNRQSL
uniref:Structural protein 2 n=1 Tax=Chipolycivirus sp. TaxID=2809300 RepID=A0AAU8JQ21_9VIRU